MSLSPTSTSPAQTHASTQRPVLFCFSHLPWDLVFQRPQHLLSRAAHSMQVVYVGEPVYATGATEQLEIGSRGDNIALVTPKLDPDLDENERVLVLRRLMNELVERYPGSPRILWHYSPMSLPFTRQIRGDVRIYDCMDELSGFLGAPPALRALEQELFQLVDLVFTGGQSLFEAKRLQHPHVHLFPSSVDTAHFARARAGGVPEPEELKGLPSPRLCWFGVIDERMDLELVAKVAEMRPEWSLVMIGPVVKISDATLPRQPNIHWLGGRSYQDLPTYLAHVDVGIMPFARNDATRFISPTKTPEFLAAAVPVVSTTIRDVVRPYGDLGLVMIADEAPAFVASVDSLMQLDREEWLDKVDRQLAKSSWDSTWDAMRSLILGKVGRAREPEAQARRSADVMALDAARAAERV